MVGVDARKGQCLWFQISSLERLDMGMMGKRQKAGEVTIQTYKTRGLSVGPDLNKLSDTVTRQFEDYNVATSDATEYIKKNITPNWKRGVRVAFRQAYPLPCTILGIMTDVKQGN